MAHVHVCTGKTDTGTRKIKKITITNFLSVNYKHDKCVSVEYAMLYSLILYTCKCSSVHMQI